MFHSVFLFSTLFFFIVFDKSLWLYIMLLSSCCFFRSNFLSHTHIFIEYLELLRLSFGSRHTYTYPLPRICYSKMCETLCFIAEQLIIETEFMIVSCSTISQNNDTSTSLVHNEWLLWNILENLSKYHARNTVKFDM